MNACAARSRATLCRDAAGWRPRLLAAVVRSRIRSAFTAERQIVGQTGRKMSLVRPRRWLGYFVSLNDLHPRAEEMLDRFERSEIPLWDTFGSSSELPASNSKFIVAFGPGVEAGRLQEVLELLDGVGVEYLQAMRENRKCIYIGTLNLENEPVTAFSAEFMETIRALPEKTDDLGRFLSDQGRLKLVT